MKAHNKILENLRNSIKLRNLDDDTIEKVVSGNTIRLCKCDVCGNIFDEDSSASVRTDMENYYGVSSDFPDHHYENLSGCPNCNSTDIEDLGLYELEDFEDYEVFNEGWTKWKHIAGPKYKYMDERYEEDIMNKLIPMLHKYGIKMSLRPIIDRPGSQEYVGRDLYNNKVKFIFSSQNDDKDNYRESKHDLLVEIKYLGKKVTAGVIDLNKKDNVEKAFELISIALEDLGVKLFDEDNNQEQETKEETNDELDSLLAFKNSLSEQELLEIER